MNFTGNNAIIYQLLVIAIVFSMFVNIWDKFADRREKRRKNDADIAIGYANSAKDSMEETRKTQELIWQILTESQQNKQSEKKFEKASKPYRGVHNND